MTTETRPIPSYLAAARRRAGATTTVTATHQRDKEQTACNFAPDLGCERSERSEVNTRPTDPRPDLADDSAYWTVLLRWAWIEDDEAALGALHGVRCCGARIRLQPSGALRIESREGYLGDWAADRERWLAPHREGIAHWLRRILDGDAEAAQNALRRTVWPVDLPVENRPVEAA
jgi:hypothetical protein